MSISPTIPSSGYQLPPYSNTATKVPQKFHKGETIWYPRDIALLLSLNRDVLLNFPRHNLKQFHEFNKKILQFFNKKLDK